MTKEARMYNGVKTVYSINGIGKIGQSHAKNKKGRKEGRKEGSKKQKERKKEKKVDHIFIPYTTII